VPLVAALLADPSHNIVRVAGKCLVDMRDPRAVEAIIGAMAAAPPSGKAALLEILAERVDPASREAVEAATKDASPRVRLMALELLGRLDDPVAEELLVAAMAADPEWAATGGVEYYLKIGDALWRAGREAAMRQYARALEVSTTDEGRAKVMTVLVLQRHFVL
jgi:HEAT repeat protein